MPGKKSNAKAQPKAPAKKSLQGSKKVGETRLMWTIMKG